MVIKYWTNFSKREDETLRPSGTGTQINVALKEPCSILRPSFILSGNIPNLNYIRVDEWDRYYFASEQTKLTNGTYRLDCVYDPLASYKSQIGGYKAFIEFATSSTNKRIYDPRNKPTGALTVTPTTLSFTSNKFSETGCYIIGVLNSKTNGTGGAACYYAMTEAQILTLGVELYDSAIDTQIENQWFQVQQSIVSLIWVPIDYTTLLPGTTEHLYIGKKEMIAEGKKLTTRVLTMTTGATSIDYASYSGGAGADMTYLENAPFTTGEMYLPFVGIVPINVEECAYTKNMSIEATIDLLTGDIVYQIKYGVATSQSFSGNIATKMPVTGNSYDAIGVASGTLAVIGGAAAAVIAIASEGGAVPLMAAGGSMLAGAASAAKSTQIHTMINGSNSSAIGAHLGLTPWVAIIQQTPTMTDIEEPKAIHGLPYYKTDTIGNLSGFVKCSGASVRIPGFKEEKDAVNSYLNKGFYYT